MRNNRPQESLEQEVPNRHFHAIVCPVCQSSDHRLRLKVRYGDLKQKKSLDYTLLGVDQDTPLYVKICNECGFVFVNPRVKPEYEHLVYNECKSFPKKEPGSQEIVRRKRKLDKLGPILESLSHVDAKAPHLTLFDYGCGFGYSMTVARALEMDCYGVDLDGDRLEACRALGFRVARPSEFDEAYPDVRADLILWQSTLEHVVDLPAAMHYLKSKAKDATVLHVDAITPRVIDIEEQSRNFVKAHFIEHLNYFTPKTLDRLMASYGFTPLTDSRLRMIRSSRDLMRIIGGHALYTLLGRNPTATLFTRCYRYCS